MIEINEISLQDIDEFWNAHIKYLVEEGFDF